MSPKVHSVPEVENHAVEGIRILPGSSNVLVVAPHGPFQTRKSEKPKYRNDLRTSLIAEAIHNETGWFTVINDAFLKPEGSPPNPNPAAKRLDLFKIAHAEQVPGYLQAIQKVVDGSQTPVMVIWIHGMSDTSALTQTAAHVTAKALPKANGEIHALLGHGQGPHPRLAHLKKPGDGDKTHRFSASVTTTTKLRDELTELGLHTAIAMEGAGNFRGRDPERLNQWFVNQGYPFDRVESIQIEIRQKGFRKTPTQCEKAAKILSRAMEVLISSATATGNFAESIPPGIGGRRAGGS